MALLWPALWNGYPLVYSDTSTYLSSGFVLDTPIDRPITYGIILRITSLNGLTLWSTVLVQSWLMAHLLGRLLIGIGLSDAWRRLLVLVAVALLTGLPFSSSQLITDIFTPIMGASLFLLLAPGWLSRREWIGYSVVFILSYAMHLSHIGITVAVLVVSAAMKLILRNRAGMRWSSLALVAALGAVGVLAMGSALAKAKNTFFAARMAEHGVLQRYLEKNCATEELVLCARMGVIPTSADSFLWADDSPQLLYADRSAMEAEFARIRAGVLADPDLAMQLCLGTVKGVGLQLLRFRPGDGNGPFGEGTLLHERLMRFVPLDVGMFMAAKQMQHTPFIAVMPFLGAMHELVMITSVFGIIVLLIARRGGITSVAGWLVACLIFFHFLNSALNASLVMVADRFAIKTAWAIPFAALVLLVPMRPRTGSKD
ncbi:MAG TPA: hypothetical protein PKY96_18975 [Flavobacteriales bacterium]|nr:hypothetical protein [Flavobacteriales bacterium]